MVVYSKVTSVPASEPVTLAEARAQLNIIGTHEDTRITSLITVCRSICEKYSQLSFITQTRRIKLDAFPSCDKPITIPNGPVIAVVGDGLGLSYTNDEGGTTSLVSGTDFILDNHGDIARVVPIDGWPTDVADFTETPNAVSLTYTAGYGAASDVPSIIKQAILEEIAFRDRNRGDTAEISVGSMYLLDMVKVYHNAHQD
jgi:uncharacterized phiE125 gp8 family phage protein